jgi:hypothetical protein
MAKTNQKAEFEPVELRVGSGWCVVATLPHEKHLQLGNFGTEVEAREWIKRRSPVWLKKYERGRYARRAKKASASQDTEQSLARSDPTQQPSYGVRLARKE